MISERQQRAIYLAGDFAASNAAWFVFNCLRFHFGMVHGAPESLWAFLGSKMLVAGQIVFPILMMIVYYLSGYYNEVFRKSRMQELLVTFSSSVINALIIFFAALVNDIINDRAASYELLLLLWLPTFALVYTSRAIITNASSRKIKGGVWKFPTLIVGSGSAAVAFVTRMESKPESMGYDVVGYVSLPHENSVKDIKRTTYSLSDVQRVCEEKKVKELIIVPTKHDSAALLNAINHLFITNLPIKITPDKYNILLSHARLTNLYGDPLVDISSSNMGEGAKNIKRLLDVIISGLMLVLLIPVYALVALMIKLDTKGSVFYRQERVGQHNKPFNIIKFRTMIDNAESEKSPQLTEEDDPRITRVGKFLRKYRIDELPQFWNVIKGDMAIVGPRPERQYYIKQILEREPSYSLIHQVRPGITSMGMVKFGYAKNVDEMVVRLSYDLLYLENMSLLNDFKIMAYTIKTVVTGKGM